MNLEKKPSIILFKWLEALFQANTVLTNIGKSLQNISQKKELEIPKSYLEEKYISVEKKIHLNNKAIIEIEKTLKDRMKKTFPSVQVFNDIDMFSRSIDEDLFNFDKENKKKLKAPLKKT